MMIAGPQLLRTKMGIDDPWEELGSAKKHVERSGMAHLLVEDDREMHRQHQGVLAAFRQSPPAAAVPADPRRARCRCDELLDVGVPLRSALLPTM